MTYQEVIKALPSLTQEELANIRVLALVEMGKKSKGTKQIANPFNDMVKH